MSSSIAHAVETFPKNITEVTHKPENHTVNLNALSKNALGNATPINQNRSFVTLSEEGKQLSRHSDAEKNLINRESDAQQANNPSQLMTNNALIYTKTGQPLPPKTQDPHTLSDAEKKEVEHLKKRDLEVKNHERAHAAIGGRFAGAPNYQYETGPNGIRYAIDGEVPIDLTEIANDPQATIDKMNQVYRAALAPLEPSSEDRSIASEAQRSISSAKAELTKQDNTKNDDNLPLDNKSAFIQSPQEKQNINIYKQQDNNSRNGFYQLA